MRPTRALFIVVFAAAFCRAQGPQIGSCPVFPADDIWNTAVDTLPVAANSAAYVNTIGPNIGLHPDFGSGTWDGGPIGIPFITVPGTQTKYPATFTYADESDPGPYAIPMTAPIEGGSNSTGDRHAIAVDTDNCILYELYSAYPQGASWSAGSGAIFNLMSYALRPATWTSADAAGLPIMPGLVRYDEVAAGAIHHALRFTVPQTQKAFVWPARHYASSLTGAQYPPMGQRFRLKASFDVSTFPPEVQVILQALKKYGMMIADNGSSWYISGAPDSRWNNDNLGQIRNVPGSAFEAVDVSSLQIDPNSSQAKQSGGAGVITIAPASATVLTSHHQQFTATVPNTSNQMVNWAVNGVTGGNSQFGFIDSTGLYTAPATAPSPASVTVTAVSTANTAETGSATVTITAPPPPAPAPVIKGISPNPVRTGRFTLTLTGTGFQQNAIVKLNGVTLSTTYVSASKLKASGSLSQTGTALPVTVTNPDGQVSNSVSINVVRRGALRQSYEGL